jgi:hypothetical protein
VELKTDALNEKSRNAILRRGAKQEGILRKHLITWTGRVRDTVYFSILETEWPAVKSRFEAKLAINAISSFSGTINYASRSQLFFRLTVWETRLPTSPAAPPRLAGIPVP